MVRLERSVPSRCSDLQNPGAWGRRGLFSPPSGLGFGEAEGEKVGALPRQRHEHRETTRPLAQLRNDSACPPFSSGSSFPMAGRAPDQSLWFLVIRDCGLGPAGTSTLLYPAIKIPQRAWPSEMWNVKADHLFAGSLPLRQEEVRWTEIDCE